MLSQKLIDKFKKIFKEKYGVEYTAVEAREAANNLVGFFELLNKIDRKNKQKEHEENKKP
ncbi:hypothetical protein HYT74_00085 [Candidatus Daviesbacteria bacterium]|nr:hypothetical protein [Candidatus Daviesbacteria bacterium]